MNSKIGLTGFYGDLTLFNINIDNLTLQSCYYNVLGRNSIVSPSIIVGLLPKFKYRILLSISSILH